MGNNKRKHLNIKEKLEIIRSLESGSNVTYLSKKYGIAKSTVCAINNRKQKIKNQAGNMLRLGGKRSTLKEGEFPKTEKRLYKWIIKQRSRNIPINGFMIKAKAIEINSKIKEGAKGFNASDGWLRNFKKRFGIRLLKISGEKLSCQSENVDPFIKKLEEKIKELDLCEDQIYNADESGLFYKSLPDKTYVVNAEKTAPGTKMMKQRITFLACTNASGTHKIKPLVVGKAKHPRCFKNFNLPVEYANSRNAWMTTKIFKNWFF